MMKTRLIKMRGLKGFRRDERGAQLIELAIVLPLFLVMFAATAEFGRFFYEYTTLAKATRAGTRYLITAPSTGKSDTEARNIVVYGNPAGTGTPIVKVSEVDQGRNLVTFDRFGVFFLRSKVSNGNGGNFEAEYINDRLTIGSGGYDPAGGPGNPLLAIPVLYK